MCLKSTVEEVIGYFGGILKTGQKEKVKVKMDKSLYDALNNYRPDNMLLDIESLVYKDGTRTVLTDEKDESDAASTSVIKKRQAQSVVDEETNDPEMLPPPPPRKAKSVLIVMHVFVFFSFLRNDEQKSQIETCMP